MGQLALAWVAKFPTTSTVILGATKPEQLLENLKALEVIPKLTPGILEKIDNILQNKPTPHVSTICWIWTILDLDLLFFLSLLGGVLPSTSTASSKVAAQRNSKCTFRLHYLRKTDAVRGFLIHQTYTKFRLSEVMCHGDSRRRTVQMP